MKKSFLKVIYALMVGSVLALTFTTTTAPANAQGQLEGIAQYLPITDNEIKDGDIITFTEGAYKRASTPYDPNLIGAVNFEPAIALNTAGKDATRAVVTKHTSHVNVSTTNGPIKVGDFITSSSTPGVGIRALIAGTVIGIALAPLEGTASDNKISQIPVEINVTFANPKGTDVQSRTGTIISQLLDLLSLGTEAAASEPNIALRYATAALVLILSVMFGFLAFGRTAANGIVAIGRNPLARRSIILAISFNILVTIAFAAAGLALSLLILGS